MDTQIPVAPGSVVPLNRVVCAPATVHDLAGTACDVLAVEVEYVSLIIQCCM